ncbi:MAG: hypothetical protein BGO70_12800 [Bacteroidetes bacterium 43-93]|nr:DUF3298 domain-containing protein [Bacteroidota bacterium]OJW99323.1 MAG: hypothetical protein BGO70_12800 [Bacteroidetes bacterium 43-93]
MRIAFALLLLLCVTASCNNAHNEQNTSTAPSTTEVSPSNEAYKRFSGTIAGQPVVLNLQVSKHAYSVMSGSYYYVKQGKPIGLYILPDSTVMNGYLVDEDPEVKNSDTQPHWKFMYDGNTITGKWTSADGKKTYDINLKEDYPQGSYHLGIWSREDSIPYQKGKAAPAATVSYQLLVPKGIQNDEADFFNKCILQELGCGGQATSLQQCVQTQIDSYAVGYRRDLADMDDTLLSEAFNNYYQGVSMAVLYNDNGWLIVESNVSDYSGGAHGNYGVSYLNMDMQNKKLWKLEDIMTVDSVKLQTILEKQARKAFDIPAGGKLSDGLLTDRVMPNGNFYITNTGITFVYNPYEIAAYAYGIASFFIPYAEIKELLKPAFVQRMQLQ